MEQIRCKLQEAVDMKKYLLVLDDLWDEDLSRWLELRNLLGCGKQGSKIIVTTRSRVVAQNTSTVEPYVLEGLAWDKSWELFRKLAFKEGHEERNPNLTNIGKEILKKCANVPLVIKTIACLLSSMDTREWESFKDKEMRTIEQNGRNILSTLKLSYDRLPLELKQCFAYCSLFPKDDILYKQDLIYLWMAQGFLWSSNESPEDVGHGYFMKLLRRCLFQDVHRDDDGEIISCKMHDIVHDLAQYVAGGDTLLVYGPSQNINGNTWHVSYVDVGSSPEFLSQLLVAKHMRSLVLISNTSNLNVNEIFSCLRCLRTLDLAMSEFKSLPDSLREMKHLRYLRLGLSLESLPKCITRLENLQTLDIRKCHNIVRLPNDINKLSDLRHLHTTDEQLVDFPPQFGKLTSLHALDEFIVGEGNGLDVLASLKNLAGNLKIRIDKRRENSLSEAMAGNLRETKLTELTLHWSSSYREPTKGNEEEEDELALKCLQPPSSLIWVRVKAWKGVRFPSWGMDELPCLFPNLVYVHISNCIRFKHLLSLGQLPNLKYLQLKRFDALEYIEIRGDHNTSSSNTLYFRSLELLILKNMPELKGWSKEEDDEIHLPRHSFFPRLSKLGIQECPKLKSMPAAPSLIYLYAYDVHWEALESTTLSSASAHSTLEQMKIQSVREVESFSLNLFSTKIDEFQEWPDLISLTGESPTSHRQLRIFKCSKLRDISSALHHLVLLEELKIIDCNELELGEMMEDDDGEETPYWQGLKSLRSLTLFEIPKLESQSLRGLSCLTSLRSLIICYCPKLIAFPQSFRNLTSLSYLTIYGCPELQSRCKEPDGQDWPLIQHIHHLSIEEL